MRAIHHIDGNPNNNDPANLRVIIVSDANASGGLKRAMRAEEWRNEVRLKAFQKSIASEK